MRIATRLTLAFGLATLLAAFIMLDRNQLTLIPPAGPVQHPFAALIGAAGLSITWFGSRLFRRDLDESSEY